MFINTVSELGVIFLKLSKNKIWRKEMQLLNEEVKNQIKDIFSKEVKNPVKVEI